MNGPRLQIGVSTWLLTVAGLALVYWLFSLGALWGILGLTVVKHVVVAQMCAALGVDRRQGSPVGPAGGSRGSGRG